MKTTCLMWMFSVLLATVSYAQASSDSARVFVDSVQVRKSGLRPELTTLPLPGEGVFYLRIGEPGGVTIHSKRRTRSGNFPVESNPSRSAMPHLADMKPGSTPSTASVSVPPAEQSAAIPLMQQAPAQEGVSFEDPRDLERYLLERMNSRLDEAILANRKAIDDTEVYLTERMDDRFDRLQTGIDEMRMEENRSSQLPVVTFEQGASSGASLPQAEESGSSIGSSLTLPVTERVERAILETGVFIAITVNFEFGKDELLPSSLPTLNAVGQVLTKYPDLRIEIAGHTDTTGPLEVNKRLSKERAAAVRGYLLGEFPAIDPARIIANGYGPSRPLASNERSTGRMLNRRVEFVVLNPEATERYTSERVMQHGDASEDELELLLREILEEELQTIHRAKPDSTR